MNRNLSASEFVNLPPMVQNAADAFSRMSGLPVRTYPHQAFHSRTPPTGGAGSFTMWAPDDVHPDVEFNVAHRDPDQTEADVRNERPALSLYPGHPSDPYGEGPFTPDMWTDPETESVVTGYGDLDARNPQMQSPPDEGWSTEHPVVAFGDPADYPEEHIDSPQVAESIVRQWRGDRKPLFGPDGKPLSPRR